MIDINSPAAFRRLVDVSARMGMPQLPVTTWAQSGAGCAVVIAGVDTPWPKRMLKRFRGRPTIVIVGADQGQDNDPLPSSWACLPGLVAWSARASILLHAAGGEPSHYRMACHEAERRGKVAIIECTPRTMAAWAEALPKDGVLAIVPREGKHPIAPSVQH